MDDSPDALLTALVYFGGMAAVLGALWAIGRWSHRRHVARYGAAPPGSGWKTLGCFIGWCVALTALISLWTWGPLVVLGGALIMPHMGFDDRAWGSWQRFRDAGIYASLLFVPIAFVAYSMQGN